jgi:hypothetical protein
MKQNLRTTVCTSIHSCTRFNLVGAGQGEFIRGSEVPRAQQYRSETNLFPPSAGGIAFEGEQDFDTDELKKT